MKRLSNFLLLGEGVVLLYPTILGAWLSVLGMLALLMGDTSRDSIAFFLVGCVGFLALLGGWRIWVWLVTGGPVSHQRISVLWWWCAAAGVLLTIAATVSSLRLLGPDAWVPSDNFYTFGLLFLPSFLHLSIDMRLQRQQI